MLKAKDDGGFEDAEQAIIKGNGLSAGAERWKQKAMAVLQVWNKQEQKEMGYLQARNAESKRRW